MIRRVVVRLGFACASLDAPRAFAANPVFDIPPDCGSEPEFRAELDRLVGSDAERAFPTSLRIRGGGASGEFTLALEVGGRARELTHADCRVLFRSALVVAAASVRDEQPEPPATSEPAAPASTPPPPSAPPPSAPAPNVPPPAPPSPPARSEGGPPLRGSAAVGAGVALGVLPGVSGAFELRGGLSMGRFGASFAARYLPARSASAEGRSVDIQGVGLRLAGSFALGPAVVLSAGVDADWLSGIGSTGVAAPRTDSAWAVAPSLEFALIPFRTEHLAVEAAIEGRLALQRPTFEVTGFREVYEVPSLGMFGLARGVWRFP
jgi:hypothetical protein